VHRAQSIYIPRMEIRLPQPAPVFRNPLLTFSFLTLIPPKVQVEKELYASVCDMLRMDQGTCPSLHVIDLLPHRKTYPEHLLKREPSHLESLETFSEDTRASVRHSSDVWDSYRLEPQLSNVINHRELKVSLPVCPFPKVFSRR